MAKTATKTRKPAKSKAPPRRTATAKSAAKSVKEQASDAFFGLLQSPLVAEIVAAAATAAVASLAASGKGKKSAKATAKTAGAAAASAIVSRVSTEFSEIKKAAKAKKKGA